MSNIHIGQKLKHYLEEQENGLVGATSKLGYTQSALYSIFRKEDLNTSILRTVSEQYGVSMDFFLKDEKSNKNYLVRESRDYLENNRIAVLEAEKKGLEKEIKLLREMVDLLKKDK